MNRKQIIQNRDQIIRESIKRKIDEYTEMSGSLSGDANPYHGEHSLNPNKSKELSASQKFKNLVGHVKGLFDKNKQQSTQTTQNQTKINPTNSTNSAGNVRITPPKTSTSLTGTPPVRPSILNTSATSSSTPTTSTSTTSTTKPVRPSILNPANPPKVKF